MKEDEKSTSKKRSRRLKGEGSIYQTTVNGTEKVWVAAYSVEGENGRRSYVRGFGSTPRQAIERRQKNYEMRINGGGKKLSKKTLKEALSIWNEENTSVKENKLRTTRAVEQHIIKRIGNPVLSTITSKQLSEIFDELTALPEKSIARNAYRSLRAILEFSIKKEWISTNPIKRIKEPIYKPAVAKQDKKKATDRSKQYVEFLKWIEKNYPQRYCLFLFMSLGLRIGELCGLETDSVDFDNHELIIDRQFLTVPSRIEKRTKGEERSIKLPVEYLASVITWANHMRPEPENGQWFSNQMFVEESKGIVRPRTTNKTRDQWRDMLYEFLTESEPQLTVEEFKKNYYYRPHFNRHITASNLAAAGIPIATAQSILGHMSSKQTEHYQHIYNKAKEEGTEALAEANFGQA